MHSAERSPSSPPAPFPRGFARPSAPSCRSFARSALLACLPFCSASSRDPLWSATGCAQAMLRRTALTSVRSGEGELRPDGELHHRREPSRARAAVLRTQPRRTPTRASFAAGAGRRPEDPALLRRSRHPSPRRRLRARRPRLPGRIWPPATGSGRGHPAAAPTWAPPPTLPLPSLLLSPAAARSGAVPLPSPPHDCP